MDKKMILHNFEVVTLFPLYGKIIYKRLAIRSDVEQLEASKSS